MDQIELPAVKGGTSILDALGIIQSAGTSAIVVVRLGAAEVVHVQKLLEVLRVSGNVTVAELPKYGKSLYFPMRSNYQSLVDDAGTNAHLRYALTSASAKYAVVEVTGDKAKVITDSEASGRALTMKATLCRCKTNPTHVFAPQDLLTPGTCNYDPSAVDCT